MPYFLSVNVNLFKKKALEDKSRDLILSFFSPCYKGHTRAHVFRSLVKGLSLRVA